MGKDILYIGIWKKGDDRMVYNLIYSDAKSGKGFAKRFNLPGVIRDREYDLTKGEKNSKIHYVSGNPNGEAEAVEVKLSQASTARKKVFEFDFADVEIKGRAARGITITKYPIRKVDFLKAGSSTLSKLNLWYDADSGRLNKDQRAVMDEAIAVLARGRVVVGIVGDVDPARAAGVGTGRSRVAISADGTRVASWLPKNRMTSLLPLACARAGVVHVPVNPLLKRWLRPPPDVPVAKTNLRGIWGLC